MNSKIIHWHSDNQDLDAFLRTFSGYKEEQYKFSETSRDLLPFISVVIPYYSDDDIFLKDLLPEKGILFLAIIMRDIMASQVDKKGFKQGDKLKRSQLLFEIVIKKTIKSKNILNVPDIYSI